MTRIKRMLTVSALLVMGISSVTFAEQDVIDLVPLKTETVQAVPDPRPVMIVNHSLNDRDVEKMARLLWSSPLRSEEEKKNLVWVVMNRAAYGDPFGTSIQDCINVHEFSFFDAHAHRSEENLRIVRESMNEWLSRADGYNPGVVIPRCAFYIRFTGENNRHMELLDIHKNVLR